MSEYDLSREVDLDTPLTPTERRTVGRLLGEPDAFPQRFKAWLKNYIESSGISLPRSAIQAGTTGGQVLLSGLPAGVILPFAGGAVPIGALPCNGAAVDRSIYGLLWDAIGTTWGPGDGATTFNLPDLRDRALYGVGSALALGATDGNPLGQRGPRHNHSVTDPQHSHPVTDPGHDHTIPPEVRTNVGGGGAETVDPGDYYAITAGKNYLRVGSAPTGLTVAAAASGVAVGPSGGMTDAPAYAGVTYMISTGK